MNSLTVWRCLGVCLLLLVTACNSSAPTKPNSKKAIKTGPSAVEHVALASEAIDRWRQTFAGPDLQQAYFHYSEARKSFPHNAELQRYHYNSAYFLVLSGLLDQKQLQVLFNQLNSWVKTRVSPPSKIAYERAVENEVKAAEEIDLLKSVIREQPYSANAWYRLALALEENKQSWAASFAARRAFELDEEDEDYRYNYGESLANIAYSTSSCHYDDQAFLKKAARYMAVASKKDEAYYLDNIALNYLNLGLFPLAHREAKKAFAAEKAYWTALRYAQSSELMDDYDAAQVAGNYLLNELNLVDGALILARVLFQKQQFDEAANYMQMYYEHADDKVLSYLILQWLYELDGYAADYKPLVRSDVLNEWYATIKSYFLRKPALPDQALVDAAKNGCQQTEANFYTAYRFWRQGKTEKTREYLERTLKSPAKNYFEVLWAKVILKKLF